MQKPPTAQNSHIQVECKGLKLLSRKIRVERHIKRDRPKQSKKLVAELKKYNQFSREQIEREKIDFVRKNKLDIQRTFRRFEPMIRHLLRRYMKQQHTNEEAQTQHRQWSFLKKKDNEPQPQQISSEFVRVCCGHQLGHQTNKQSVSILKAGFQGISADHNHDEQQQQSECYDTVISSLFFKSPDARLKKKTSLSSKQLVRCVQFVLPRLQKDFSKLKESMLIDDIRKCTDKSVYCKIAAAMEVLNHKIQVMGALSKVCEESNQLQSDAEQSESKGVTQIRSQSVSQSNAIISRDGIANQSSRTPRGTLNGTVQHHNGLPSRASQTPKLCMVEEDIARLEKMRQKLSREMDRITSGRYFTSVTPSAMASSNVSPSRSNHINKGTAAVTTHLKKPSQISANRAVYASRNKAHSATANTISGQAERNRTSQLHPMDVDISSYIAADLARPKVQHQAQPDKLRQNTPEGCSVSQIQHSMVLEGSSSLVVQRELTGLSLHNQITSGFVEEITESQTNEPTKEQHAGVTQNSRQLIQNQQELDERMSQSSIQLSVQDTHQLQQHRAKRNRRNGKIGVQATNSKKDSSKKPSSFRSNKSDATDKTPPNKSSWVAFEVSNLERRELSNIAESQFKLKTKRSSRKAQSSKTDHSSEVDCVNQLTGDEDSIYQQFLSKGSHSTAERDLKFDLQDLTVDSRKNFVENRQKLLEECKRIQSFLRRANLKERGNALASRASQDNLLITGSIQQKKDAIPAVPTKRPAYMTYQSCKLLLSQLRRDYLQKNSQKDDKYMASCFFSDMFRFCFVKDDSLKQEEPTIEVTRRGGNKTKPPTVRLPRVCRQSNALLLMHGRDFQNALVEFAQLFARQFAEETLVQESLATRVVLLPLRSPRN